MLQTIYSVISFLLLRVIWIKLLQHILTRFDHLSVVVNAVNNAHTSLQQSVYFRGHCLSSFTDNNISITVYRSIAWYTNKILLLIVNLYRDIYNRFCISCKRYCRIKCTILRPRLRNTLNLSDFHGRGLSFIKDI